MFVVGWVTRALYASSVFSVCSLAFDTESTVLPPALTKRSVSFSPCVRLRSAFCGAAIAGAKSRALNTNGAVRAIDVRMFHPFLMMVCFSLDRTGRRSQTTSWTTSPFKGHHCHAAMVHNKQEKLEKREKNLMGSRFSYVLTLRQCEQ